MQVDRLRHRNGEGILWEFTDFYFLLWCGFDVKKFYRHLLYILFLPRCMVNWFGALDFEFKSTPAFGKCFIINEVVQINIIVIYFISNFRQGRYRERKKIEKEKEKKRKREKDKIERKFRAKIQRDLNSLTLLLVCPSINKVRGSEVKLFLY